jgi:hypothetical protein
MMGIPLWIINLDKGGTFMRNLSRNMEYHHWKRLIQNFSPGF